MTIEENLRQENTYWSREMAELLAIGNSTLRKWCLVLEAQGYRFIRDDKERRAFTNQDALALRYFKELTQTKGFPLDSAAKSVITRFNRDESQDVTLGDIPLQERHDTVIDQLLNHIKHQEEFNQALLQELTNQRRYIEESLNRRDELLMLQLRELFEVRKELAITEQKKRKWWKRR